MIPTGWSSTSSVLSAIALGRAHVLSALPGGWGCAGRSRCENGKAPVCLFIFKVVQREQIGQSVRRDHTVHSRRLMESRALGCPYRCCTITEGVFMGVICSNYTLMSVLAAVLVIGILVRVDIRQ